MALQAKCLSCKKRLVWKREQRLRDCNCPICGRPLKATTHLSGLPILKRNPSARSKAVRE